jgi:hypothetical protein
MAKNTTGGTTKGTGGVAKARRAPGRRRTDKKPADTVVASAPDLARSKPAAQLHTAVATEATDRAVLDADFAPSPDEVQRRAYELYVRRGGTHGGDLDDWFDAECQLRNRTH